MVRDIYSDSPIPTAIQASRFQRVSENGIFVPGGGRGRGLSLARKRLKATDQYRSSHGQAWLVSVLHSMVQSKQVAVAATPHTEISVTNASFAEHGYQSMRELVGAIVAVTQGSARKSYASGPLSANVLNVTAGAAAAGFSTFGFRLRITASHLNWAFRPILVDIGPVLNTAGTLSIPAPVISMALLSRRLPIDVFILSPSNAAGYGTVSLGTQDDVVLAGATTVGNGVLVRTLADATTFAIIESLNARDLIARTIAGQEGFAPPSSNERILPLGIRDASWDNEADDEFDGVY